MVIIHVGTIQRGGYLGNPCKPSKTLYEASVLHSGMLDRVDIKGMRAA